MDWRKLELELVAADEAALDTAVAAAVVLTSEAVSVAMTHEPESEVEAVPTAEVAATVAEATSEEAEPELLLLDETVPGLLTRSESCSPSGTGPSVCAGQDPAGETGVVMPKGIVPAAPTARPPTKVVSLAPANWHWKSPSSSAFLGAL